jgi:hypothetical protein
LEFVVEAADYCGFTSKPELIVLGNITMSIANQRQSTEEIQTELDELSPFDMMSDVESPVLVNQNVVANQNDAMGFLFLNGTCG